MRNIGFFLVCYFILDVSNLIAQNRADLRNISFDTGWSFEKTNIASGPEKPDYDVSAWRKLDLPHDWSIEDLPNQDGENSIGPFSKNAVGTKATGYTVGGTAWYRKSFILNSEDQGKTVYIQFDGVYMNSDVWINGHHLGNHPHGYTPFYYDLTPFLQPVGQENIIAVQVKNEGRNTRFYSGSGIYRHVWLVAVNPVHIDVWGVFVTTPKVNRATSDVQISSTIKNDKNSGAKIKLVTQLIDGAGRVVGKAQSDLNVGAGERKETKQLISVVKPQLWSPETPNLYTAKVTVIENNKETDALITPFGIRDLKVDAKAGLMINGENVKLKGGCVHHDNGPLGSAAIDRAEERKIEILKANGYNAIRSSHYPPSSKFLEACDRLGMLVIDEAFDAWNKQKRPEDYHLYFKDSWNNDLTSMILHDRNHPSVIFWSIGNEIWDWDATYGQKTRDMLKERVKQLDSTRFVTEAITSIPDWSKNTPHMFQSLDVCGYNYQSAHYKEDHQNFPDRVIMATEHHPQDMLSEWQQVEEHPNMIGAFVWTAIDYIGEAAIGFSLLDTVKRNHKSPDWPWFNANCGSIDLIGNKRPQSYYSDVVWRNRAIAIAAHAPVPKGMVEFVGEFGWPDELQSWNWPEAKGDTLLVSVYSRCQKIKLELNGKLIGEKIVPENTITTIFDVPYELGTLIAKGFIDGKEVASTVLKTTGAPAAIRLTADRAKIKADRNDLSFVSVEIVDSEGNVVPNAENMEVSFTISGDGELAGVGNGNPTDISSFKQPKKKVFHGKALAIVRPVGAKGNIKLTAASKGLKSEEIEIKTF